MQLGRILPLVFCLSAGLLSCSAAAENAHNPDSKHEASDNKPSEHQGTTPSPPNTHPPPLKQHIVNQSKQGKQLASDGVDDTVQSVLDKNGERDVDSGRNSGDEQHQQGVGHHLQEAVERGDRPEIQEAVPGPIIAQPKVMEEKRQADGAIPLEHAGTHSAHVKGGGDKANAHPEAKTSTSAVPTVHIPSVTPQDAQHPTNGKTAGGHTHKKGADDVQPPFAGHFTTTSTTTESSGPITSTTDSPVEKPVDQIESPPIQQPTVHQHDTIQQEPSEPISTETADKKETTRERLLPDAGGVMLEKSTEAPPKTDDEGEDEDLTAEDFPSFGEWRQKVLEEQEKEEMENKVKLGGGNGEGETQPTVTVNSQKLRVNYAAKICGAKVVASNPEMENGNHMLTANRDEYMINPCSARKWFVVELCEPVMVKMVELASLELFSSHPHSFRVALSDRYPTKEWVMAGTYDMTVEKSPQLFTLTVKSPFVKFVRMEMLDHFGNEHYCPVTLFRVFGVAIEDDDTDDEPVHNEGEDVFFLSDEEHSEGNGESKTLFTRTKETVVNLVKKVLYKGEGQEERHDDHAAGSSLEKQVNVSSEGNLPCDPNFSGDSFRQKGEVGGQKPLVTQKREDGAEVTVNHPQPTITTMPSAASSASVGQEEIPMVTKLDDGDQVEIEEDARESTQDGQRMVKLLQSGNMHVWGSAVNFCRPRSRLDPASCSYKPLCVYVQAMLGEPPPFTYRRPHLDVTMTVSPTVSLTLSSASSSEMLEPSFQDTVKAVREVSEVDSVTTLTSTVTDFTSVTSLQPSSQDELVKKIEASDTETATIPTSFYSEKDSVTVVSSEDAKSPAVPAKQSQTADVKSSTDTAEADTLQVKETVVSSSEGVATKPEAVSDLWLSEVDPNLSTRPRTAKVEMTTDSQAIETDAQSTAESTSTTVDDITTSQSASSDDASSSQQDTHKQDEVSESLEPSIHLETTSVVSPSLTRPTPVLEMERASVESDASKHEVRETAVPCVSPSPTSVSAHGDEGEASQSAFPEIVAPTIEPSQKVEPQAPSSDLISSTGATNEIPQGPPATQNVSVTQDKNETEKRAEDLDLVHVPLTVSAKRETAIMRLTNRIKALELNVSLSSRFLEELSTRFKKQNEELMKMLNKTVSRINATAIAAQRQTQEQEVRIERLEMRVDNLTLIIQQLADRFDTFAEQMTDRQMIATSVNFLLVVIAVLIWLRSCKPAPLHPDLQFLLDTMPRRPQQPASNLPRRNSETTFSGSHGHNPDWGPSATLRKGGSVANLSLMKTSGKAVMPHDYPPSDEQRETGTKKKKRKKSKAFKASCGDLSSDVNKNNSLIREVQTTAGVLFGVGVEGRMTKSSKVDDISSEVFSESGGRLFGHRRCGSASANISISGDADASVPPKELTSGVQFFLGGQVLSTHVETPVPIPVSVAFPACLNCGNLPAQSIVPKSVVPAIIPMSTCCENCGYHSLLPVKTDCCVNTLQSVSTGDMKTHPKGPSLVSKPSVPPISQYTGTSLKPPIPPSQHSRLSLALSAPPPPVLKTATARRNSCVEDMGPSYIISGASASSCRLTRPTKSVELPRNTRLPEMRAVQSHPVSNHQPVQSCHVFRPKKLLSGSLPIVNGDRGGKMADVEHMPKSQRKGSFRNDAAGHEDGKGPAPKHEPTKFKGGGMGGGAGVGNAKPWRGQSF